MFPYQGIGYVRTNAIVPGRFSLMVVPTTETLIRWHLPLLPHSPGSNGRTLSTRSGLWYVTYVPYILVPLACVKVEPLIEKIK